MQKNLLTYIFLILSVFFIIERANSQDNFNKLMSLKKEIDKSYYSFNTNALKILLKKSDELCSQTGDWHAYYYSGLLNILLGKIYYNSNSSLAYDYFDESLDKLLKAEEQTNSCEVKTLISCAYGKKSSLNKIKALYYGLKAKEYIEEAYELDKNNPKLYLIASIHLMHTPKTFGGDKDKSRNLLIKCIEYNKSRTEKDKLMLDWAENAEIYAYLAQLEILLKSKEKAKIYMNMALELVQDYGFVKNDLAKQLERIGN